MEDKVITYRHHNKIMHVILSLQGKHKEHCLCYRKCKYFIPEDRDKNCPIASILFAVDCAMGVTTPVWECEKYTQEP